MLMQVDTFTDFNTIHRVSTHGLLPHAITH